jgi:hypothetical protein
MTLSRRERGSVVPGRGIIGPRDVTLQVALTGSNWDLYSPLGKTLRPLIADSEPVADLLDIKINGEGEPIIEYEEGFVSYCTNRQMKQGHFYLVNVG